MAQGILQDLAHKSGLSWEIDSAGTGAWHVGETPDHRAVRVCTHNGLDITDQRARQFHMEDFDRFDVILTMDETNYRDVLRKASTDRQRDKVRRIISFAPDDVHEIPDPYFDDRFEEVYDLLTDVCQQIIREYDGES